MSGVRNGPIARVITSSAGKTVVGTVPVNFTWLIKTVHVLNSNPAAAALVLELDSPAGGPVAILETWNLDPFAAATWTGWTALGPGDQAVINSDQVGTHVWISGAELPGVAGESSDFPRVTPYAASRRYMG